METLRLTIADTITAEGTVESAANSGGRVWYRITCDHGWRVLTVEVGGAGPEPALALSGRNAEWSNAAGRRLASLSGCIDVDVSITPFTCTLPIRRLALRPSESRMIEVACIDVDAMATRPAWQRYTCLRASASGGVYRHESVASGESVELEVDADRLVVDYPGRFRRADCPPDLA